MIHALTTTLALGAVTCLAAAQQSGQQSGQQAPPQQQQGQQGAQQVLQQTIAQNRVPAPLPPQAATPAEDLPVIQPTPPLPGPSIDLVICLDTSGSMSGLINAARQKLWDIVNDLALAEPTPSLRVALLTFGNDGHSAEDGWVRIDAPLTDNLDVISERLFAMTTNGGSEYVGRVVHYATEQLEWHPSEDAMRLMIVAGNESADQDQQVSFRDACKAAITKSIMINSIYCGSPTDAEVPAWKEVSQLADGHFATIDQDNGTVVIESPFDERLMELSAALNETYIPYGEHGAWGCNNQVVQDSNAAQSGSAVAASRVQTKANALYRNTNWDLVDACKNEAVKLAEVDEKDLPEVMKPMTQDERAAYVAEMAAKRATLQKETNEVAAQRQAFVETQLKAMAEGEREASFDHAVRKAVRTQAEAKGYRFAAPEAAKEPADGGS